MCDSLKDKVKKVLPIDDLRKQIKLFIFTMSCIFNWIKNQAKIDKTMYYLSHNCRLNTSECLCLTIIIIHMILNIGELYKKINYYNLICV